jgi:hypothetical protein
MGCRCRKDSRGTYPFQRVCCDTSPDDGIFYPRFIFGVCLGRAMAGKTGREKGRRHLSIYTDIRPSFLFFHTFLTPCFSPFHPHTYPYRQPKITATHPRLLPPWPFPPHLARRPLPTRLPLVPPLLPLHGILHPGKYIYIAAPLCVYISTLTLLLIHL